MYSLGPFERDGTWMAEHLNVDPGTRMVRQNFFNCGGRAAFEVFEYSAPDQSTVRPRNSDLGGHHVSLYVDDLDAAVTYLHQHGVTVFGEPTVSGGATEGQRWVYFLAPWGMQFELVSYPGGKAFERARAREAPGSHAG
jgi:glyoxylase I family protein